MNGMSHVLSLQQLVHPSDHIQAELDWFLV